MLDIILDTLIDALKLLPFLYIAFFIIEIVEHKMSKKNKNVIKKAGKLGPLAGSLLGIIPQCGFSVLATNLYITRIISLGTLISIYLSTSDEMLVILLSEQVSISIILKILLVKFIIGMICGFIIDFVLRKKNINKRNNKEDYSICHDEHCHCEEEKIWVSALIHTIKTITFIIIISFILNIIMEYLGNDFIESIFMKDTIFSPFISSLVGLIPNCGASVILTELYVSNVISFASVIAGLLTGSGVALLVLFRTNKNLKENLSILAIVYLIGVISGILIEIIEMII